MSGYVAEGKRGTVWRFTRPESGTGSNCFPNYNVDDRTATLVAVYGLIHQHPDTRSPLEVVSSGDLATWPPRASAQFNPRVAMTEVPLIAAYYYSSRWEDLMGSPVLSQHRR